MKRHQRYLLVALAAVGWLGVALWRHAMGESVLASALFFCAASAGEFSQSVGQ